jgi:hypothetical protein
MLQSMFHLVSVCCSRCCSPRALTRGHTRAARTHPALPISVIRAALIVRRARNDDQCLNGRVLSGQSASAHAERQSGPAPNGRRTRRPCTTELAPPHRGACNRDQHRYARYASILSLACSWVGPTHMPSRAAGGSAWRAKHADRHSKLVSAAAGRCAGVRTSGR